MTSLHASVNLLHTAYCESMAIEPEDLPMTLTFECWWLRASNSGMTCDHVRIAVKERLKFNRTGSFKRGVELRHLIRSDEDVAIVLNEYAAWKANQRVKVVDPAKVSVLAATGRPATAPETEAVRVGALPLIEALKRAAQ